MSLADAMRRDGRYLAEHYGVYGTIPMVFRDEPIVLVMAGRAGSSFAVKWFLHHNPVETDFVWAHRIRVDVVYPAPWHKQRVQEVIDGEPVAIVRFTRHPYPRAVSAYLHSLRQARPRGPIAAYLGQDIEAGYSFAQYLDAMGALVPLAGCDEHGYLQRTLLDTLHPLTHPYRVEDGPEALRAIETSLDLAPTDDATYQRLRSTNHDHEYLASTEFLGRTVLDTGRDANRTVQRYQTFYDDNLLTQVDRIYGEDFERFGYRHEFPAESPATG